MIDQERRKKIFTFLGAIGVALALKFGMKIPEDKPEDNIKEYVVVE